MLPNIGTTELIIILVIGLLLFGRRLPEIGRSMGKAIVEFKKGVKGVEDEVDQASSVPPASKPVLQGPADVRAVSTSDAMGQKVP